MKMFLGSVNGSQTVRFRLNRGLVERRNTTADDKPFRDGSPWSRVDVAELRGHLKLAGPVEEWLRRLGIPGYLMRAASLMPLDIGFDPRMTNHIISLPPGTDAVIYESDGRGEYLVVGAMADILAELQRAGYRIR